MVGVISRGEDTDVNGRLLLQLCCNNALCITNTSFQHKDMHKHTWCRDSLGQWSLFDLFIVAGDLFRSVLNVRVKRGAELSTDRHLLVSNLRLEKTKGPAPVAPKNLGKGQKN